MSFFIIFLLYAAVNSIIFAMFSVLTAVISKKQGDINVKKRVQQFITIVLTILVLCSFSYVYASASEQTDENSKYYQDNLWGYSDSYYGNGDFNSTVYFLPPAPKGYKYYVVLEAYLGYETEPKIYLYLCNSYVYRYGGFWLSFGDSALYSLSSDCLSWDFVKSQGSWTSYNFRKILRYIDSTVNVVNGNDSSGGKDIEFVHNNGYMFYWTAICILEKLLLYMENIYSYVLSNQILQLVFLVSFVGEVIWFVVTLFSKVGELRNEEE